MIRIKYFQLIFSGHFWTLKFQPAFENFWDSLNAVQNIVTDDIMKTQSS